jgi:hypothetical protein
VLKLKELEDFDNALIEVIRPLIRMNFDLSENRKKQGDPLGRGAWGSGTPIKSFIFGIFW